jgi:hypothetical protein
MWKSRFGIESFAKGDDMKPIWIIGQRLVPLTAGLLLLLLTACGATAPRPPLYFDVGAWDPDIRSVALVEVTFDRRYPPPTDFDLERDLRIFLGRELERKGYRIVATGEGGTPFAGKSSVEQLAALVPAEVDAALAIHVDYLFISATFSDRNPPPQVEIAAEARLVARDPARELWRDWADAVAGGPGGWPVGTPLFLRQEALQELAALLFDTLPDAGRRASDQ